MTRKEQETMVRFSSDLYYEYRTRLALYGEDEETLVLKARWESVMELLDKLSDIKGGK